MFLNKETNIDNVWVNRFLSPIIFVAYFLIYMSYFPEKESLTYAIHSIIVYYFCSRFFQPDLDNTPHRPGKYSFPLSTDFITSLSKVIKTIFKLVNIYINRKYIIEFILMIIRPISFVWYIIWEPYALLFTHRGLSHFPIIGTYTRIIYLGIILHFIDRFLHINSSLLLEYAFPFLEGSSIGNVDFKYDIKIFVIYFSPIFLSDIIHSLFDFIEAKGKGNTFIPSKSEPGYLSKLLKIFKINIKI